MNTPNQRLFVEISFLRNFPPANLNRDQRNQPKTAQYGTVARSRISPQSYKRAVRFAPEFAEAIQQAIGTRTKHLPKLVMNELVLSHHISEQEAKTLSESVLEGVGFGTVKDGKTSVLVYISPIHVQEIARLIAEKIGVLRPQIAAVEAEKSDAQAKASDEENDAKKKKGKAKKDEEKSPITQALKGTIGELEKEIQEVIAGKKNKILKSVGSPDIALFGRMLAEFPALHVDAACQVAQIISTNQLKSEFDFYTAVDDVNEAENEQGAGMMGLLGFNSACFYGYAVVDVMLLLKNLGGDREMTLNALKGFIHAYSLAVPIGKQTSTAPHTPPSLVMTVVRNTSAPCSLANAFEKPVRADSNGSLVENSIKALDTHWHTLTKLFGGTDNPTHVITQLSGKEDTAKYLPNLQTKCEESLQSLINSTIADVSVHLSPQ